MGMGDHVEAMSCQQKAVLMSERVNGIDHPYAITEYTHLALYCFANTQVSTALKLLYRARFDRLQHRSDPARRWGVRYQLEVPREGPCSEHCLSWAQEPEGCCELPLGCKDPELHGRLQVCPDQREGDVHDLQDPAGR